jgi:membrane protease YdiL (CAAX protease family)
LKKEYWYILIVYIAMQLSGIIGLPLMVFIGKLIGKNYNEMAEIASSIWIVISFSISFLIILYILRKEIRYPVRNNDALSIRESIFWAIGGIFMAFFAQIIAANIEIWLGIEMRSENTEQIVGLIKTAPLVILVTSIIAPILEEIVFRKIIFGSIYRRTNFIIAALISTLIFAFAHGEPEHLILYSSMGFTFAYLYVKTNRILVPIFAHVSMNTIVVIQQLNQDFVQQIQSFIGGFLI